MFFTCRQSDVKEFDFVYLPLQLTGNSNNDAVTYLCHLNIATNLYKFKWVLNLIFWKYLVFNSFLYFNYSVTIPDQMIANILALDDGIREAEIVDNYLRNDYLMGKMEFYKNVIDLVREKQEKR